VYVCGDKKLLSKLDSTAIVLNPRKMVLREDKAQLLLQFT